MTSTSDITGTGLKKCMPITCVGRAVAAARVAIGMEEVFEARIASRGQDEVGLAEDRFLHGGVLDNRLDHQVRLDDAVHRLDAREHLVRIGAALLCELLEAAAHRLQAAFDRTRGRVVERDATA